MRLSLQKASRFGRAPPSNLPGLTALASQLHQAPCGTQSISLPLLPSGCGFEGSCAQGPIFNTTWPEQAQTCALCRGIRPRIADFGRGTSAKAPLAPHLARPRK